MLTLIDGKHSRKRRRPQYGRTILFPLLVLAALAWLASETLRGDSNEEQDVVYSDLIARVQSSPSSIELVTFVPRDQRIEMRLTNGGTLKSHYPSEASQLEFQRLLQANHVRFESEGTGSSKLWTLLTTLIPFVLLLGFWIFLMDRARNRAAAKEGDREPGQPEDESRPRW